MKKLLFILSALLVLGLATGASAALLEWQDGYIYNLGVFPDADGDGIPNGMDPDYVPPLDGTGSGFGDDLDGVFYPLQILIPVPGGHLYGPGDGTGDGIPDLDGDGNGPGDCLLIP